VASDEGLRAVCGRAGVSWEEAQAAIVDPRLRERVEQDTSGLIALGHWGVPVMVLRGEPFWGQDRIGDLEAALDEAGLRRGASAALAEAG
jgi:2-hydroxychromene-2-carboxylate isomerase